MKLRTKISLLLVVLTVIAISVFGHFGYIMMSSVLENAIGDGQVSSTRALMDEIDYTLYERHQDILSMSEEPVVKEFLLAHNNNLNLDESESKLATNRMQQLTDLSGPWDDLYIIDLEGSTAFSTNKAGLLLEKESKTAWEKALSGKVYVSDLNISPGTGRPTIIFAAPIRAGEPIKKVQGVALGNFSWPLVQEILKKTHTSHLHLFNKDGLLIASNQEGGNILNDKDKALLEESSSFKTTDGYEIRQSNEKAFESITSYAHQKGYLQYLGNGWTLISETPTETAFRPIREFGIRIVIFFVATIGIAEIFLGIGIRKIILVPIEKLTLTANEISKGNFDQTVDIKRSDEIGTLANSFNTMSHEVAESQLDLQKKVRQRTKEANDLNDMLKILNTIMRHDILNDVTAVEGNLDLYEAHKSKESLNEVIDTLKIALKRSKDLIYKMKDLEKAMATGADLQTLSATEIAQKAKADFADTSLKIKISGDKAQIEADEALPSVFVNLFRNSKMHGEAKNIAVDIKQNQTNVEISVADDGKGIPDELKAKLFQEGAKFGKTGNTGLGLYVIKKTMERYGGNVEVKDNKPQGAKFVLSFPKEAISKAVINEMLSQKGQVRGVVFETDRKYIEQKYGPEGVQKLAKAAEKLDLKIPYKGNDNNWYPIGLRCLSLMLIKETFKLGDKEIRDMGSKAPSISPVTKLFVKYFVNLKKLISKSQALWQEHYTTGKIEISHLDEENNTMALEIAGVKLHSIFSLYLEGYFESILRFVHSKAQAKEAESIQGKSRYEFRW